MKNIFIEFAKDFRYERKFFIEGSSPVEVELQIRQHPMMFREIFHKRWVNNIYLDTIGHQHFWDSKEGVNQRMKVRIRWYGDLFGTIKNPILELKIKDEYTISKLSYPLKDFNLYEQFSIFSLRKIFQASLLDNALKSYLEELNLSLLNRYQRKYFLSFDGKYRITIDDQMMGYKLTPHHNNFFQKSVDRTNVILELKYNTEHDQNVQALTNHFSFRVSKSSKYVEGLEVL